MSCRIHPAAVVDPDAELGEEVEIGPHAVVGPGVILGDGTAVGASATIAGPTTVGRANRIAPGASIGSDPQDLRYRGESTRLEIGDRNQFREFCTINRGTVQGGGVTTIGDDNLFMAYTHVGHDCHVGSRTVFANAATLGGHVEVQDDATISAFSSIHQFCRVGRHAYVGGYSVITQDALPFAKTVGVKPACYGLNRIGLERKGIPAESVRSLDRALRLLLRGKIPAREALAQIEGDLGDDPEVRFLVEFIRSARRGVVRALPGRRGSRGGG